MYCTYCGNELLENSKFCHSCGQQASQNQTREELTIRNVNATKQNTLEIVNRGNLPIKKQAWKPAVVGLGALFVNALLFTVKGYMIDLLFWIFWVGIIFAIVQFIRERKLPTNLSTKENEKSWSISKWESDGKKWIVQPALRIKNNIMVFDDPSGYIRKLEKLSGEGYGDDIARTIDELKELQSTWVKNR
jgi:hypothetical protein